MESLMCRSRSLLAVTTVTPPAAGDCQWSRGNHLFDELANTQLGWYTCNILLMGTLTVQPGDICSCQGAISSVALVKSL
jgi:hypothetical protein